MRMMFGLCALMLALPAASAFAQPQGAPRGSYQRQCTDIRMNGQFLSATCRGAQGGGQSSINVMSCSGDIGVDATGALSCAGPGAAAPAPPAYVPGPPPRPGHNPGPGYGDRPGRYGRDGLTLYGGRNMRGPSARIEGEAPNLGPTGPTGLNDRPERRGYAQHWHGGLDLVPAPGALTARRRSRQRPRPPSAAAGPDPAPAGSSARRRQSSSGTAWATRLGSRRHTSDAST